MILFCPTWISRESELYIQVDNKRQGGGFEQDI